MGRRRSNVNGFLDSFGKAYGLTKGVMGDFAVADKDGHAAAQAEADASGGKVHTLDKGQDDKGMADYQSKNKSDIDMIAQQEDDIRSLQNQGLDTVTPRAATPAPSATQTTVAGASDEPKPAAGYTRGEIEKPKLNATDIYMKKYAPRVVEKLMQQGNDTRAKEFEDWTRSQKGARYGDQWMQAVMAEQQGDVQGALKHAEQLYNMHLPDGQQATVVPGDAGKYTVEIRDEKTNKLLQSVPGEGKNLAQMAIGMLSPEKAFNFMQSQQAAATKRAQDVEDKKTEHGYKMEEKAAEAGNKRSPLMQLQKERDEMAAANPKDPRIKVWDRKIKNLAASGENGGVNIFTGASPDGQGNVVLRDKAGNIITRQAPGVLKDTDKARNALNGVVPVTQNGRTYYTRNGARLGRKEAEAVEKHVETLRQFEEPLPWEQKKDRPGLK